MLARTRWCTVSLVLVALAACGSAWADEKEPAVPDPPPTEAEPAAEAAARELPRSVILIVVDGMGPQQTGLLWDSADAAQVGPTHLAKIIERGTSVLITAVGPGEHVFAGLRQNEYIGTTPWRWMQAG